MRSTNRRGMTIFFLVFGICLVALAIALQVGWILFSLERIVILILGIIFFAAIITGLVLNTIFLVREIRRNEQHNAFINAVTHELKTPVASLRLYLETLKTRDLTEEKRQEFYNIMLADTDRLHQTIDSVLQAGRIGNPPKKEEFSPLDLNELLFNSLAQVRSRYNLKDENFHFVRNGSVKVFGNSEELQTVFVNLLDNAVKYSKENVLVNIEVKNKNNKQIEVAIEDSGIGIAKSELKRIFQRFYRASNKPTQRVKGTGLGLFIVNSIVRKHGGQIVAESRGEGKGSRFVVQLLKAKRKVRETDLSVSSEE
jgi:two-component system, OmpR family, sensor histidine kinase SenX3